VLARAASVCWIVGFLAIAAIPARGRDIILAWAAVMTDVPPPLESTGPEQMLLRETAAQLRERSPTFRQMLDAVAAAPHLRLTIRPIVRGPWIGRTHYWVRYEWTYGVMEVHLSHRDPHLRMRAVAHEVAHSAEIACLPAYGTTGDLLTALRIRPRGGLSAASVGETPFAEASEKIIVAEFDGRRTSAGALPELAARFGLVRCRDVPTVPAF
jgi:hypothetical protein